MNVRYDNEHGVAYLTVESERKTASLESAPPEQQKDADEEQAVAEFLWRFYHGARGLDPLAQGPPPESAFHRDAITLLAALRAASEPQQQEPEGWRTRYRTKSGGWTPWFWHEGPVLPDYVLDLMPEGVEYEVVPLYRAGTQGKQTGGDV